jgi:hypothetical protein
MFDIRLSLEQDTSLLHSDQKSAFLAEMEQTLQKVKNVGKIFYSTLYSHTVGYLLICVEQYPYTVKK